MLRSKCRADTPIFQDEKGGRWSTRFGEIIYCLPYDYIFGGWLPVYPTQRQKEIVYKIGIEKLPKGDKERYSKEKND